MRLKSVKIKNAYELQCRAFGFTSKRMDVCVCVHVCLWDYATSETSDMAEYWFWITKNEKVNDDVWLTIAVDDDGNDGVDGNDG